MDWVKDLEVAPDEPTLLQVALAKAGNNADVDVLWMNKELFSVLSLKTTDDPLQITKGVKDAYAIRGAVAWHKITREVAGRTGARLERLADKVHHPKKITSYGDALAMVNKWDLNCKELAKIEG